ncbi:unnamed protein product [Parnassius mnemosyne]|uniref:Gustatory receptor n=1 Tax=Parnassius mnemosyne TaxID=213953 RepID=A0AAV1LXR4_9NEOP
MAVVFFTSEVNTTSRTAITFLYKVSSRDFCTEVQRLIDLSHYDEVALSGLRFFYVTREFALSVVGTIITYELVLLQFHSDFIQSL